MFKRILLVLTILLSILFATKIVSADTNTETYTIQGRVDSATNVDQTLEVVTRNGTQTIKNVPGRITNKFTNYWKKDDKIYNFTVSNGNKFVSYKAADSTVQKQEKQDGAVWGIVMFSAVALALFSFVKVAPSFSV